MQVIRDPCICYFSLSGPGFAINSMRVTSGGAKKRMGGPHVPEPLLT
jgi:hypothetical protein